MQVLTVEYNRFNSEKRNARKLLFFFFNDTATTEIYTLSLHDALPIRRNFGMKMLTMTNLSTECLIQLTKLGYALRGQIDRKSGSAGMPRPISYAVFCLKKKNYNRKSGEFLISRLFIQHL